MLIQDESALPAPKSKRKHRAQSPATGSIASPKRQRKQPKADSLAIAAAAMEKIGIAMESTSDAQHQGKAVDLAVEEETDLSEQEMLDVADLFTSELVLAETYLAIQNKAFRRKWLHHRLEMAKKDD